MNCGNVKPFLYYRYHNINYKMSRSLLLVEFRELNIKGTYLIFYS